MSRMVEIRVRMNEESVSAFRELVGGNPQFGIVGEQPVDDARQQEWEKEKKDLRRLLQQVIGSMIENNPLSLAGFEELTEAVSKKVQILDGNSSVSMAEMVTLLKKSYTFNNALPERPGFFSKGHDRQVFTYRSHKEHVLNPLNIRSLIQHYGLHGEMGVPRKQIAEQEGMKTDIVDNALWRAAQCLRHTQPVSRTYP